MRTASHGAPRRPGGLRRTCIAPVRPAPLISGRSSTYPFDHQTAGRSTIEIVHLAARAAEEPRVMSADPSELAPMTTNPSRPATVTKRAATRSRWLRTIAAAVAAAAMIAAASASATGVTNPQNSTFSAGHAGWSVNDSCTRCAPWRRPFPPEVLRGRRPPRTPPRLVCLARTAVRLSSPPAASPGPVAHPQMRR